jgi:hypothetical protein
MPTPFLVRRILNLPDTEVLENQNTASAKERLTTR